MNNKCTQVEVIALRILRNNIGFVLIDKVKSLKCVPFYKGSSFLSTD